MVTQPIQIMEVTKRRITNRYQGALCIVALTVVLMAFVTDHLVDIQYSNSTIANNAAKEMILVQRISAYAGSLNDQDSDSQQREILQSLSKSVSQLEEVHLSSGAALAQKKVSRRIFTLYYSPPFSIDERIQSYLKTAHALLRASVDDERERMQLIQQLQVGNNNPLLLHLDKMADVYQQEMNAYLNELLYSVFGLTAVVIGTLFLVSMLVLRPAISYVAQAQAKLEELNQLKGDFLANMSHEIRTPMNGIFGMTELLGTSGLNSRQQHYVRSLQTSADHLLGLINDILDFSKIEAGQMKMDPVRFDLLSTIEEVLELLSARARDKGLELLLHYPPGTPRFVTADPGRVRQILFNLVGNAIKFTDHGYVIVDISIIATGDKGYRLSVRVEDTGIGIPEDKVTSLFEKFMQVESGSNRAQQGTGLGLAISRNLVNLMGGDMRVESAPGKGTVFFWHIPLPQADELELPAEHSMVLAGKTVLLVDDLAPNRRLFKEALEAAQIKCLLAENAQEALSVLSYEADNKRTIHAMISDYIMPGMDGIALVKRLREDMRFMQLPVMMLTSQAMHDIEQDCRVLSIAACLPKPVGRKQLLDMLAVILDPQKQTMLTQAPMQAAVKTVDTALVNVAGQNFAGRHILLVEDNKVNMEIISEMLMQMGCKISTAGNGRLALDAIKAQDFDLVFMDCQMPEMDGFEAAGHIRALKEKKQISQMPVVALTANALKGDKERCLQSGMDDYVTKPVRKANLEQVLLKWLGASAKPVAALKPVAVQAPVAAAVAAAPKSVPVLVQDNAAKPAARDIKAIGVDVAAFMDARNVLGDKLSMVLGYYLEDAERYIEHIARALQKNELEEAVRPAHTLKSSSQQFGAINLAKIAAHIERRVQEDLDSKSTQELATLVKPMRDALAQAKDFYRQSMAS